MEQKWNSRDPCQVYADILDLPHHQSDLHPHMSFSDRAAQFAPFAALSGYDEMVAEEARDTQKRQELSEHQLELLNRKLALLRTALNAGRHPECTLVFFVPDERKAGGSYDALTGRVKRIDLVRRQLVLCGENGISDGRAVDLDAVSELSGGELDGLEEENWSTI